MMTAQHVDFVINSKWMASGGVEGIEAKKGVLSQAPRLTGRGNNAN